jgi:hypothetical protein
MALMEKLQMLITADAGGAIREFKKVGNTADKDLGKATKSIDRMSSKMMSLGSGAVIGAIALGAGLASLAKDASEAEHQQLKLNNSIKNSDQAFAGNGKALRDQASALMKVTAADDDAIVSAQALMVQFGKSEDEVLALTPLVVDLSRKLGVDLDTASKAVSKSSEGSFGALKKMGIAVTDLGGGATATESTVAALSSTVGGFAEAEGQTFAGQLEIMNNKFGELRESLGAGVLEVVNPLLNMAAAAGEISPAAAEATGKLAAIGTIGAGLVGSLSVGTGAVMKMKDNFTTMSGEGDNAKRKLTGVGKAAGVIAAVGAAIAIYEIASALNEAAFDAAKYDTALTKLSTELIKTGEVSAKSFQQMAESSAKPADSFYDIITFSDTIAKSFSLDGLTIQFDDALRVLNDLAASGDTATLQGSLEALTGAQYNLGDGSDASRIAVSMFQNELDGMRGKLEATKENTQAAAAATAGLSNEFDLSGDLIAQNKAVLEGFDEQLKLTTLSTGGAAAAAESFAGSLEMSTVFDNAISNASSMGSAFRSFGTDIKALPKDIDLTKLALGQYTEEQQKSIEALVSAGDANSSYLSGLVEQGATAEEVAEKADLLRFGYISQAKQLGLNDVQTQKYLQTLGLTPQQVNTAMKLTGDADARFRIEALQGIIAQTPPSKLTEYKARIDVGDYQGAARALENLSRDRTTTIYPRMADVGGFLGQLLNGGGRDGNPFTPMARGGRVGNQTYQVNEKGPELFTPSSSGFIMNAGDTQAMLRGVSTLIAGGGRGASQVHVSVPVTFAGPVAQDSVRWITDTITKAARTGILSSGVLSGAGR